MHTHILICCHNGSLYIKDQINSIIDQRTPDLTIHLHDFASTDGTLEIANEYNRRFHNLVKISSHDDAPGPCLSFFRAFKLLTKFVGDDDCIIFVDQDDVWLPSKLAEVHREFKHGMRLTPSGYVAIFHDVIVVDEKLNELRPSYYTGNPFLIPRDLDPDRLLFANPVIGHTMAISGKLLRRVSEIRVPSNYMMHDWAVLLFASRLGSIFFIPKQLSLYRQHGLNIIGAYGGSRRSNIVSRLLKFASSVCIQARDFARELEVPSSESALMWDLATRSNYYSCLNLSIVSFVKGPTFKRKLLSIFIAWYALLIFLKIR